MMYDAYLEDTKVDIVNDVFIKANPDNSPVADVVDSYWITKLLWEELRLREGIVQLKDMGSNVKWCFTRITKSKPFGELCEDFII